LITLLCPLFQVARSVNFKPSEDGTFWMVWNDFIGYFKSIDFCHKYVLVQYYYYYYYYFYYYYYYYYYYYHHFDILDGMECLYWLLQEY
jgi:hypothetical protein